MQNIWLIPTYLFSISEFKNPSHDIPEPDNIRLSPVLEAVKLWKGRSGWLLVGERERKFKSERKLIFSRSKVFVLYVQKEIQSIKGTTFLSRRLLLP